MFEVGMEFIRNQAHAWEVGEITSISEDANGITLIGVLFEDGAVKTYTEDYVMKNLGGRILVTETAFA